MISVPMDPREFAAKKLGRVRDGIGAATTSDERKVALKRAVTEFPLVVEFWLQFVDAAEDKRRAWDEAVSRCAHVQELWTAFLETATSAEDAKRAKDAVGSYFLSSSIWKTLLDRTADDTADNLPLSAAHSGAGQLPRRWDSTGKSARTRPPTHSCGITLSGAG